MLQIDDVTAVRGRVRSIRVGAKNRIGCGGNYDIAANRSKITDAAFQKGLLLLKTEILAEWNGLDSKADHTKNTFANDCIWQDATQRARSVNSAQPSVVITDCFEEMLPMQKPAVLDASLLESVLRSSDKSVHLQSP